MGAWGPTDFLEAGRVGQEEVDPDVPSSLAGQTRGVLGGGSGRVVVGSIGKVGIRWFEDEEVRWGFAKAVGCGKGREAVASTGKGPNARSCAMGWLAVQDCRAEAEDRWSAADAGRRARD